MEQIRTDHPVRTNRKRGSNMRAEGRQRGLPNTLRNQLDDSDRAASLGKGFSSQKRTATECRCYNSKRDAIVERWRASVARTGLHTRDGAVWAKKCPVPCFQDTGHNTGSDLLSHNLEMHYHRLSSVSLPCSEWERVGPLRGTTRFRNADCGIRIVRPDAATIALRLSDGCQ